VPADARRARVTVTVPLSAEGVQCAKLEREIEVLPP
jgi:hypothetical protein